MADLFLLSQAPMRRMSGIFRSRTGSLGLTTVGS
jgi:hypothetical protein